jgi:hypothetical protein
MVAAEPVAAAGPSLGCCSCCEEVVAPLVLVLPGWILEDDGDIVSTGEGGKEVPGWGLEEWDAVPSGEGGEDVSDPRPLMMKPPRPVEVGSAVAGLISGVGLEVVSSLLSLDSSVDLLADTSSVLEGSSVSAVLDSSSSSVLLLILGTTNDSAVASTVFASTVSVVSLAALFLISVNDPFSVGQNGVCVFVSTTVSTAVTHTSWLSQDTLVDVEVNTVVHAVRTGRAGAQDVIGISFSCSWTVGNVSR